MSQKLYAGIALKDTRNRFALSQRDFATRLGVSLPYLSQMENNHRPISASVVLALAAEFDFDVTQLSEGTSERLIADLQEALSDPIFANTSCSASDLQLVSSNASGMARAFLELHRNFKQSQERLAALDDLLERDEATQPNTAWEEVRDFFHYCNNYVDAVDIAAERFAKSLGFDPSLSALVAWVETNMGLRVRPTDDAITRRYDPATKDLFLMRSLPDATKSFQILHQIALLSHSELLDATLDLARFQSDEARKICKIGLANYFAGAAQMPYLPFLQAAQETRHDLQMLAGRFGASIEQVAHRLSTLQRPGLSGIPFFFVRVDQAGTITKRHSATKLQFARFGGACPLWNVHRAFETPGRFLRQLAETPDGARYFCLARAISKSSGAFNAPTQRYAIGLGCEIKHASALVYADEFDLQKDSAYEPIGISCRICARENCHQRSVPPLEHHLEFDLNERRGTAYKLADS